MSAEGVSHSAFNLAENVPAAESALRSRQSIRYTRAAEWATAEPEEDEYMQYFDWDRFEAEQGDEEAAEQGGAAGGEQAGEE